MSRLAMFATLATLALAAPLSAQSLEPPPEASPGEDYEVELADSLEIDAFEMSIGAAGRSGGGPRRLRRVRFSADSLAGGYRQGVGDPLSGGSLRGRVGGGSFRMGRLGPRWGRGLLLGGTPDPWTDRAADRGTRARYRGRAGEGAWLRGGRVHRYELLYGRFAKRGLLGVRTAMGLASLGAIASGGVLQGSLGWMHADAESELAVDRSGRWRAEAVTVRRIDRLGVGARVRGGSTAFRSVAEPSRSGPARALAVWGAWRAHAADVEAHASMWRYRAGLDGARLAVSFTHRRPGGETVRGGFEEQQGVRRLTGRRRGGIRQGWWWSWRGGPQHLRLALRHEAWGRASFARDPVRVVTAVRVEVRGHQGLAGAVTHTAYRTASGENLYLAEARSDRLVLRALSGVGERTRIEAQAPFAGGFLRATAGISIRGTKPPTSQWTFEWTRRARYGRRR